MKNDKSYARKLNSTCKYLLVLAKMCWCEDMKWYILHYTWSVNSRNILTMVDEVNTEVS